MKKTFWLLLLLVGVSTVGLAQKRNIPGKTESASEKSHSAVTPKPEVSPEGQQNQARAEENIRRERAEKREKMEQARKEAREKMATDTAVTKK